MSLEGYILANTALNKMDVTDENTKKDSETNFVENLNL